MPFIGELRTEWGRQTKHVSAWLKLSCPAGTIVSHLNRGRGLGITYSVEESAGPGPQLLWPPDPTSTHYGERCSCYSCFGRLVGATVDELRAELVAIRSAPTVNEGTSELRYLESARDVIEREAQSQRYVFHRNISSFTDTYVKWARRVIVRYDGSFQGEVAEVTVEPPTESYPPTLVGAVDALRGPDS